MVCYVLYFLVIRFHDNLPLTPPPPAKDSETFLCPDDQQNRWQFNYSSIPYTLPQSYNIQIGCSLSSTFSQINV